MSYVANIMHVQSDEGTTRAVWLAYKRGFASGYRVALVVHKAQKTVPDLPGERPTFSPALVQIAFHRYWCRWEVAWPK